MVQQQQSSGEALAAVVVVREELEIHRDPRGAIAMAVTTTAIRRRCHQGLFSLEAEGQEVALFRQGVRVPFSSLDMRIPPPPPPVVVLVVLDDGSLPGHAEPQAY